MTTTNSGNLGELLTLLETSESVGTDYRFRGLPEFLDCKAALNLFESRIAQIPAKGKQEHEEFNAKCHYARGYLEYWEERDKQSAHAIIHNQEMGYFNSSVILDDLIEGRSLNPQRFGFSCAKNISFKKGWELYQRLKTFKSP